jgi:hypothetical protein
MAIAETLIIAAPAAVGVSLATPKEYSTKLSLLLASMGLGCGIIGLYMARQGQPESALVADTASIMFDLLSILKALEMM